MSEGKPLNTVKLSIFDILIFPIVKVRLSIMLEIPTILLIVCLSVHSHTGLFPYKSFVHFEYNLICRSHRLAIIIHGVKG